MLMFSCNSCGQKIKVEDRLAGNTVTCPQCGKATPVPGCPDKIRFGCESCGQRIAAARDKADKKGRCPKCGSQVVIPGDKSSVIAGRSSDFSDSVLAGGDAAFSGTDTADSDEPDQTSERLILSLTIAAGVIVPLLIILIALGGLSDKVNLNPLEMLRQIPGPIFLLVFIALTAACAAIGWLCTNADMTNRHPLPDLTRLDPYAIAALRGGEAAVMQAIVLNLLNQKLVSITPLERQGRWGKREFEIVSVPSARRILTPLEEEVYQFLETPKNTRQLFESDVYLKIKIHLDSVYDELEELHLAQFGTSPVRRWAVTSVMALIVGTVG
ncbi:MAG: hypothetical protein AMJ65_14155, partial [Phycisphaerae bacterium SG8_4]